MDNLNCICLLVFAHAFMGSLYSGFLGAYTPGFGGYGPMVGIWNGELYVHIGGSDPSGDLERGESDVHDWYHMHIALSCIGVTCVDVKLLNWCAICDMDVNVTFCVIDYLRILNC